MLLSCGASNVFLGLLVWSVTASSALSATATPGRQNPVGVDNPKREHLLEQLHPALLQEHILIAARLFVLNEYIVAFFGTGNVKLQQAPSVCEICVRFIDAVDAGRR
jgi:hypothetical protein